MPLTQEERIMTLSPYLQEVAKRRTFAIISHPDAGKTTITEKVLLFGQAIQTAGTVKGRGSNQHAKSDWMEMEKQRGISITRGLSRAGITFQQEHAVIAPAKQEPAPRVYYKILFLRGNMHEVSSYQCSEILTYHKTFIKKGRKVSLLEFFLLTLRCECTKI